MRTALLPTWGALVVVGCLHGICQAQQESGRADFVVSPEGNDTWAGTYDKPFASLERARTAVKALEKDKDIVVLLRGGYYALEDTVAFGMKDSAPEGHTISCAACPGETRVMESGVRITGWEKVGAGLPNVAAEAKGKLWSAPIPAGIDTCTVLFDGETWLPGARGNGFLSAKKWARTEHAKHRQDLWFPSGAVPEDAPARGAEIRIVPNYPWVMNLLPLSHLDVSTGIARLSVEGFS